MRIITKFTLLYLVLLFITLAVGGVVTYQSVKQEVKTETDYSLREETRIIAQSISEGKPIDALENIKVQIHILPENTQEDARGTISDTLMMHNNLKRMEVFRFQTSTHKIGDHVYAINVADVFIEENDMLEGVINTMLRLFIVLSLLFIVFGFIFSKIILNPFDKTLNIIDNFDIGSRSATEFPKSSTKEFVQLNMFLNKMMNRVSKDYNSLKEFSENASHEMQTPLAIAKGKLEILQESERLKEAELDLIITSQKELSKLSNLTHALGLLTKLDNEEFKSKEPINFSEVVQESLSIFTELASLREIEVNSNLDTDVVLKIEKSLADVLVSNLLKNSIQHNIANGKIGVTLSNSSLIVKNTGKNPKQDPHNYFDRFSKHDQSSGSLGLGLSIVKKICDLNDLEVGYHFQDGWHELKISF